MKNILFFSVFPLQYGGGLEKYYIERACELSDAKDVTVSIIQPSSVWMRTFYLFLSILTGEKKTLTLREDFATIKKKLGAVVWKQLPLRGIRKYFLQSDVIYVRNEMIDLLFLKLLKVPESCVVIAGTHTPIYFPETSFFIKMRNFLYRSKWYRFLARRVDIIHVINRDDRLRMERLFPEKKIFLLHNPFDFKAFAQRVANHVGEKPFQKESSFTVAWVGLLKYQKGIPELISIIDRLHVQNPGGYRWIVCGNGELASMIVEAAKKYDNLVFLGQMPNEKIADVLLGCDAFLATSHFETFNYSVLEAQACGLPVVSLDTAAAREMIDPGINGYIAHSLAECAHYLDLLKERKGNPVDVKRYISEKFSYQYLRSRTRILFTVSKNGISLLD